MSLYRDLTDLVAGDPVVVSVPGYRMRDDPDVYESTVVKVARKYLYVANPRYTWDRDPWKIDRAIGVEYVPVNEVGNRAASVYTPAQWETHRAADEARDVIKAAGLEFRTGHAYSWSDAQIVALGNFLNTTGVPHV